MHVILLLIAIAVCLGIAKVEKSNKMFWLLLISMLVGYAMAGILSYIDPQDDQQQCVISIDNPTQTSTCSFQALPVEGDDTFTEIKSVGQGEFYTMNTLISKISSRAITTNVRDQPFIYDTS